MTNHPNRATPTITFEDHRALVVFFAMAEGMCEVQEDNRDFESTMMARRLDALMSAISLAATNDTTYPLAMKLPKSLRETAETVLENCLDSADCLPGDADADDCLYEGQVVII